MREPHAQTLSSPGSSRRVSSSSVASSKPEAEDDGNDVHVALPERVPLPPRLPSYTSSFAKRGFSATMNTEAHHSPPAQVSARLSGPPSSLTRATSTATSGSMLEDWKTAHASSPTSVMSDSPNPPRSSSETARLRDDTAENGSRRTTSPSLERNNNRRSSVHSRTPERTDAWLHDDRTPQATARARYFAPSERTEAASVISGSRTNDTGLWDEVEALRHRLRRLETQHTYAPSTASSFRSRINLSSRYTDTSPGLREHAFSPRDRDSSVALLRQYLQRLRRSETLLPDEVQVALELATTDVLALSELSLDSATQVRVSSLSRALAGLCAYHLGSVESGQISRSTSHEALQSRLSRRATMAFSRPASSLSSMRLRERELPRESSNLDRRSSLYSSGGSTRPHFQSRLLTQEIDRRPVRYMQALEDLDNRERRQRYESTPEQRPLMPISRVDRYSRYRRAQSDSPRTSGLVDEPVSAGRRGRPRYEEDSL